MANKKKRKRQHRHPVAPPVHSAPGTAVHHPSPPPPMATQPVPGRPMGAEPPAPAPRSSQGRTDAPRRARQTPGQRQSARRRKTRRRGWLIAGSLVVLLVAALVLRQLSNNKAASSFNAIAKSAGCSQVRTTSESGAGDHLKPGERTTYDIDPPTHGKHAPTTLAAGVYDKPLSTDPSAIPNIYQSVHSLEHGAIIVWYDGLAKDDVRTLDSKYRSEEKVIVVPYPKLGGKTHVAMTAWGRMVTCGEPSTKVIDAFIKRFREARSAPEPLNRI